VPGAGFAWKSRKIIEKKHLKITMNLKEYVMAHNFKIFIDRTIINRQPCG
jgi:hypothetical protein